MLYLIRLLLVLPLLWATTPAFSSERATLDSVNQERFLVPQIKWVLPALAVARFPELYPGTDQNPALVLESVSNAIADLYSPADGTIVHDGTISRDRGYRGFVIRHADGIYSLVYVPHYVNVSPAKQRGSSVAAGERLGSVSSANAASRTFPITWEAYKVRHASILKAENLDALLPADKSKIREFETIYDVLGTIRLEPAVNTKGLLDVGVIRFDEHDSGSLRNAQVVMDGSLSLNTDEGQRRDASMNYRTYLAWPGRYDMQVVTGLIFRTRERTQLDVSGGQIYRVRVRQNGTFMVGRVAGDGFFAGMSLPPTVDSGVNPAEDVAVQGQPKKEQREDTNHVGSQVAQSSGAVPSDSPIKTADPSAQDIKPQVARHEQMERERLTLEADAARKRQQELEERLAFEARERQRQTAEVEAERKKRRELEEQLLAESAAREKLLLEARARERTQSFVVRSAHALVIGNAAYPGSARLDNPLNDASAISEKLRSMGFAVTTVTDVSRPRMLQALSQFMRAASNADVSLFFYSGHGVQVDGTNYILPTDIDQTDAVQATLQGVSLNTVIENFLPGKTRLIFLDACRDNPLRTASARSVAKGLAPVSVARGTLIAYATKDGQTAADGVGARNSPFTQALLEHIDDPQDIGVVLRKVREKVMQITGGRQEPWEYGSLVGGELVLSTIRSRR